MQFKDLKTNYPIYVLDKNNVSVSVQKVQSISAPRFDSHYNNSMVVDLVLDNASSYVMKSDSDTAYVNNLVITPTRDTILREIEAMKVQSEQILSTVDRHKDVLSKCSALLEEYNPEFKQQKATEERFSKIENSLDKLTTMMEKLMN